MSGTDKMHLIADEYGRVRNIDVCAVDEPTQTWPYMLWINPGTQVVKVRNAENTGWVTVGGGGGGGPHHETHENGGDDEISVAGLSGELADPQPPKTHATDHSPGEADALITSDFAGDGLEDDGAGKLRIKCGTQGQIMKSTSSTVQWALLSDRLVTVGPSSCDATTLGEAVIIVNTKGPPTADAKWAIWIMPGTQTTETGDVAVPQYTVVFGEGREKSAVNMAGYTLYFDKTTTFSSIEIFGNTNSALVTNTDVAKGDGAIFDDCLIYNYGQGPGLYLNQVHGIVQLVNRTEILAENALKVAGTATDTSQVNAWHCRVQGSTRGLWLCDAYTEAYTYWTYIEGGTYSVHQQGGTWKHICCQVDWSKLNIVAGTMGPLPTSSVLDLYIEGLIDEDERTKPANPASGRRRLYPKADGWYDLDATGTEAKLGGEPTTTDGQAANTIIKTDANAGIRPKRLAVGNGVAVPGVDGRVAITEDILPFSDGAGLFQRSPNSWFTPITHFNEWAGWSWAGYAGFCVPDNIDIATYPSIAMIWNSAADGVARAFAYRSTFRSIITTRCAIAQYSQRTGLRMDDASNNNYVEIWLDPDGTGLVRLWYRYAVGGVVTGPTQLWAAHGQPSQWYTLTLYRVGDNAYLYSGVDTPFQAYISVATITGWSPARSGVYHELVAANYGSPCSSLFDWYYQ